MPATSVTLELLDELEAIAPVTAVYGNTDGQDCARQAAARAPIDLDGFNIVVTHGDQFGRGVTPDQLHEAFPDADIIAFTAIRIGRCWRSSTWS